MKPLIGITANYDFRDTAGVEAKQGLPGQTWHLLSDHYTSAIENAGAIPVVLPIYASKETVHALIKRLDGVLLSGGVDVAPYEYGARIKQYCGTIVPKRDKQELEIVKYVMSETRLPILGICRGVQVMNVAGGGTLYQDLMIDGGYEQHACEMSPYNNAVHKMQLEPASRLAKVFGSDNVWVNSFHHQGVYNLAPGYRVTAKSEDGVIEAIEYIGDRYAVGVQWHPEMMYDSELQQRIFRDFVKECCKKIELEN